MNEGDIHITVTMPSAVSLERGAVVLREMRLELLAFPEVKDVLSEQGHPEDGTDDEAPNQSETFVIMKPQAEWHTGRTKEQVIDAMRAELEPARRRLQLQPADQGPRRGVDLGHPRADRREDLRRRPEPHARQAGRGQSHPERHARRARRRRLPRRHRAAHRRRRRSRGGGALRRVGARRAGRGGGRVRRRAGDVRVGGGAAGRRAREDAGAGRGRSGGGGAAGGAGERQGTRAAGDAGERARRAAGGRRSTGSRGGVSWRSRPTSTGATWGASSPRRRRASRRG